jgi:hypothetical protein
VNLLTAEQVIDRLSESPRTRRLAVTCVLPAVWCEDGWRFRERDLEAWIAQTLPHALGPVRPKPDTAGKA